MTDQGIVNRLILEADNHAAARDRLYMECARLTKAVEDLVEKLASASQERQHAVAALSEQVDTVRAERDEARRMYCEGVILHGTAHRFDANGVPEEITDAKEFARTLRWDCYKENTND